MLFKKGWKAKKSSHKIDAAYSAYKNDVIQYKLPMIGHIHFN